MKSPGEDESPYVDKEEIGNKIADTEEEMNEFFLKNSGYRELFIRHSELSEEVDSIWECRYTALKEELFLYDFRTAILLQGKGPEEASKIKEERQNQWDENYGILQNTLSLLRFDFSEESEYESTEFEEAN